MEESLQRLRGYVPALEASGRLWIPMPKPMAAGAFLVGLLALSCLVLGLARRRRKALREAALAGDQRERALVEGRLQEAEGRYRSLVQELQESEARLQGFIRHASAAIAFKGPDGRYLLINPRMEILMGRPSREILGRTNEDLLPSEVCALIREREDRVLRLGEESMQEEAWTLLDGARRNLLVHKFPLADASGPSWGVGVIITDITERKQSEAAMLQSQKLESLGVLAGGIAHDFNNLLGAMQGNAELAMMEASQAGARSYLEILTGLISKGADLLRQLLAYAGKGTFTVRVLDLNQVVKELTQLLASSISKKATLRQNLNPQPLPLEADPSQLQQVIMNLVINASEALEDQNGTITLRTRREQLSQGTLRATYEGQGMEPGTFVSLEVSDNGSGMTPAVLKKIFDPFFTTKFTGRGLGLAAIHGIVRSHHGGILVFSEPGQGSTFKVMLPGASGTPDLPAPDPLRHRPLGAPMAGGTVLVVDDEDPMRGVVVTALNLVGFETLEARNGREALLMFQTHHDHIQVILMDLTMPIMDGAEACRELRRRGATVPVILSSGFNETEALRRFEGLGLAGFIQKPFSLAGLVDLVRKVLAGT
jgi:PAS domain S-box-containing protein